MALIYRVFPRTRLVQTLLRSQVHPVLPQETLDLAAKPIRHLLSANTPVLVVGIFRFVGKHNEVGVEGGRGKPMSKFGFIEFTLKAQSSLEYLIRVPERGARPVLYQVRKGETREMVLSYLAFAPYSFAPYLAAAVRESIYERDIEVTTFGDPTVAYGIGSTRHLGPRPHLPRCIPDFRASEPTKIAPNKKLCIATPLLLDSATRLLYWTTRKYEPHERVIDQAVVDPLRILAANLFLRGIITARGVIHGPGTLWAVPAAFQMLERADIAGAVLAIRKPEGVNCIPDGMRLDFAATGALENRQSVRERSGPQRVEIEGVAGGETVGGVSPGAGGCPPPGRVNGGPDLEVRRLQKQLSASDDDNIGSHSRLLDGALVSATAASSRASLTVSSDFRAGSSADCSFFADWRRGKNHAKGSRRSRQDLVRIRSSSAFRSPGRPATLHGNAQLSAIYFGLNSIYVLAGTGFSARLYFVSFVRPSLGLFVFRLFLRRKDVELVIVDVLHLFLPVTQVLLGTLTNYILAEDALIRGPGFRTPDKNFLSYSILSQMAAAPLPDTARPADPFKGEKYLDIDIPALYSNILSRRLVLSYDTVCRLPVCHAAAHQQSCQAANSLSGRTDGEGIERKWTVLNASEGADSAEGAGLTYHMSAKRFRGKLRRVLLPDEMMINTRGLCLWLPRQMLGRRKEEQSTTPLFERVRTVGDLVTSDAWRCALLLTRRHDDLALVCKLSRFLARHGLSHALDCRHSSSFLLLLLFPRLSPSKSTRDNHTTLRRPSTHSHCRPAPNGPNPRNWHTTTKPSTSTLTTPSISSHPSCRPHLVATPIHLKAISLLYTTLVSSPIKSPAIWTPLLLLSVLHPPGSPFALRHLYAPN
ncbi:hypothetical protein C8F01DRAFT_1233915 [Mycena amicta]|nr:hypothetical protein C8F01DRAFT_1233915 [Mycena amicta]